MIDLRKLDYQMKRNMLDGRQLAARIGISENSVSKIRTGKTQPQAKTMKALCETLDCKPEDLLEEVK